MKYFPKVVEDGELSLENGDRCVCGVIDQGADTLVRYLAYWRDKDATVGVTFDLIIAGARGMAHRSSCTAVSLQMSQPMHYFFLDASKREFTRRQALHCKVVDAKDLTPDQHAAACEAVDFITSNDSRFRGPGA